MRAEKNKKKKDVVISVRMDTKELEALHKIADSHGITVSALLRTAARDSIVREPSGLYAVVEACRSGCIETVWISQVFDWPTQTIKWRSVNGVWSEWSDLRFRRIIRSGLS